MNGKINQSKKTPAPAANTTTSIRRPKTIKTVLITAPIILDVILKVKTSKYLVKLNPRP